MNHEPQTFVDLQDAGNAQSQLILQAIARHANWDTGVCFPSVSTLARMGKCSDKTVRRHLKALQADKFITITEMRYENGSQASSEFTLVGYAEWIAANRSGGMVEKPRKAKRYKVADAAPERCETDGQIDHLQNGENTNDGGENVPEAEAGQQIVNLTTPPGHLLTTPPGQQVSIYNSNTSLEPSLNEVPLTPQAGDRKISAHASRSEGKGAADDEPGGDVSAKQAGYVAALKADGAAMTVVDRLLAPMLAQRRFSSATAMEDLRAARNAARGLSAAHLDKALGLILSSGVGTIKPSRLREAIDVVTKAGLMVVIRKGTPQWSRWFEHFAATGDGMVRLMRGNLESVQVPSEWPPSAKASPSQKAAAP